jgi:hypothetical protein
MKKIKFVLRTETEPEVDADAETYVETEANPISWSTPGQSI